MRAVVLFDIDGTLIRRAGPHHREALVDAIRDVSGIVTSIDHIPTQGMLDRDIIQQMLRDAGAPDHVVRAAMPAIVKRAQEFYRATCPDLTRATCPGSMEVLRMLRDAGIPAGLVTGHLSGIAWKKMAAAGLSEFLQFGAFAEMGETRAELVGIAVAMAKSKGWVTHGTLVSLVGDHPNDVDAAKRNAIRSVAVCTGVIPRLDLQASGPDLIFDDLTQVRLVDLVT